MNSVFVGGSRHVSKLPPEFVARLDNLVRAAAPVLIGDADGADTAVQRYLAGRGYRNVTVFCSGNTCRNNVGGWKTRNVTPPARARGYRFFAAKDREMTQEADFGLMVWDGKSPGSILNILRLAQAGKKSVLYDTARGKITNFKSPSDWQSFLAASGGTLVDDLRKRATPEEWSAEPHDELLHVAEANAGAISLAALLNSALDSENPATVAEVLGTIARDRGMTRLAREAGLARESLYRALSANGNPEFATVFRVLKSLGLRLSVGEAGHQTQRRTGDHGRPLGHAP